MMGKLARPYCSRDYVSAALFACAILLAINSPPLISLRMGLYLWCLAAGYYFAPKAPAWSTETLCALVIAGSAILAIPISLLFDDRNTAATAYLAALTALLLPLMFVGNIRAIFLALIPVWYLQAAVMAWQWFAEGATRAGGMAENENAGSAFLLMGAIFLLHNPRLRWLAVPLLVALPLSGSRWTVIVGTLIIGLMFCSRRINWRYSLAAIVIAVGGLVAAQHNQLAYALLRVDHQEDLADRVTYDTAVRVAVEPSLTMLIPAGFRNSLLHSVPIRMTDETGILSALAWLAASVFVLWRRKWGWQSWCLVAICLLSVLYYHTWIGPMGAFWWLLLSKGQSDAGIISRSSPQVP